MAKKIVSPLWSYLKETKKTRPVGAIEGEFSKSITLRVSNTAAGQPLYFNSDTELDNAIIRTIEIDINTNLNKMQYQGVDLDPITQIQSTRAVLVLIDNNRDIIATMPLSTLVRSANKGKPAYFLVENLLWQNCYIEITDNSGYSTSNGFFLRVTYNRK